MRKTLFLLIVIFLISLSFPDSAFALHGTGQSCKTHTQCHNLPAYCDGDNTVQLVKGYCDITSKNSWVDPQTRVNSGCVYATQVDGTNPLGCFRGETATKDTTSFQNLFGRIKAPKELAPLIQGGGGTGAGAISILLSNALNILYALAAIVFIFMIVWGAFQWIISGGDKEAVAKARARITHAIIGIVILSLAFVIISVLGQITGFQFFKQPTALPHTASPEELRDPCKNVPLGTPC